MQTYHAQSSPVEQTGGSATIAGAAVRYGLRGERGGGQYARSVGSIAPGG